MDICTFIKLKINLVLWHLEFANTTWLKSREIERLYELNILILKTGVSDELMKEKVEWVDGSQLKAPISGQWGKPSHHSLGRLDRPPAVITVIDSCLLIDTWCLHYWHLVPRTPDSRATCAVVLTMAVCSFFFFSFLSFSFHLFLCSEVVMSGCGWLRRREAFCCWCRLLVLLLKQSSWFTIAFPSLKYFI